MPIPAKILIPALLWLCAAPAAATTVPEQGDGALRASALWAHTEPGMARMNYCHNSGCLDTLDAGSFFGHLLAARPEPSYNLSFWVRSFDGAPTGPMLKIGFSGLVASANAALLQMNVDSGPGQQVAFDDFRVAYVAAGPGLSMPAPAPAPAPAPVPEPAALALLLAGAGALVLVTRRRG